MFPASFELESVKTRLEMSGLAQQRFRWGMHPCLLLSLLCSQPTLCLVLTGQTFVGISVFNLPILLFATPLVMRSG